ncbi:glycosyltransferase family 4 protein [uncultured Microbulbifer sp.]|uniref:MraY family glycosyltransferase n=1 Tax=uncultured Microbulbifer sp. TaxID=348147 RepID=UPI0025D2E62C|nr:glycosyltransferase family 4 protein [uncultured Microbulbifer sp.]
MEETGYPWWGALLLAVATSLAALQLLLSRLRQLALDIPNHRSLHETPVPRTGGWAMVVGVFVALLWAPVAMSAVTVTAFALLLAVSLADDLRTVSARLRFAVQAGSVALLLVDLAPGLAWWLMPILLIGGVWVVNLYNFMDGMDGFAGSMTAIGFGTLAGISAFRGEAELAGICGIMAASSMVFLYYNWPAARIFLGDAGSTSIGLAVFAVSVYGWQQSVFSPLVPLIIFSPFWVDATYTLLRRMYNRERWWEAHRQHLYQRSALSVGTRKTLGIELTVMLGTSLAAISVVALGLA